MASKIDEVKQGVEEGTEIVFDKLSIPVTESLNVLDAMERLLGARDANNVYAFGTVQRCRSLCELLRHELNDLINCADTLLGGAK